MTPPTCHVGDLGPSQASSQRRRSWRGESKKGFTLIELLIVSCIIAVLVSLTLLTITTMRESAYRTACANNLRQLGIAALAYRVDNRNHWLPGYPGYWPADLVCVTPLTLEAQYGLPLKAWVCPAEGAWLGRKSSLWYETTSNNPTTEAAARASDGYNVLMAESYVYLGRTAFSFPFNWRSNVESWEVSRGREAPEQVLAGDLLITSPTGDTGGCHLQTDGFWGRFASTFGANQLYVSGRVRWIPGARTSTFLTTWDGYEFRLKLHED